MGSGVRLLYRFTLGQLRERHAMGFVNLHEWERRAHLNGWEWCEARQAWEKWGPVVRHGLD